MSLIIICVVIVYWKFHCEFQAIFETVIKKRDDVHKLAFWGSS